MGNCFRTIDVLCNYTADAKGQQRFFGMDPQFMATFDGQKGYFKKNYEFWGETTGSFKAKADLVSEHAHGFHNLRYPAFMKRIYSILYPEACPKNSTLSKNLNDLKKEISSSQPKP